MLQNENILHYDLSKLWPNFKQSSLLPVAWEEELAWDSDALYVMPYALQGSSWIV